MRALALVVALALIVDASLVLTRDPEEAWAVAGVILATAVAIGAIVTLAQLRGVGSERRRVGARRAVAVRRGVEVSAMAAFLLWLRAIDGLSVLTAALVVGTFVVAEAILSARPRAAR